MADNAPLTKQELLEAISNLATKHDITDIRLRMATKADVKNEINEMRGVMATKQDIEGNTQKIEAVEANLSRQIDGIRDYLKTLFGDEVDGEHRPGLLEDKVDKSEFDELHHKAHAN